MNTGRAIELQEQAWSLQAEGKLEEALLACRQALRIMEEAEGPDSPDVANLLNDLAEIEEQRQNFAAALALAGRARAIEDVLGRPRPDGRGWKWRPSPAPEGGGHVISENAPGDRFAGETAARIRARTLALLGTIRRVQGDYAGAESDLKMALAVAAEFGEASEEAAEARNNLAVLYKYWGRFEDGLRLYEEALHSILAVHGEACLASAVIYHNIGGILHSQGDFAAAEEPGRKAWDISRQIMGEDDPRTMLDAAAYAAILDGLERYGESERIYRRALATFEKAIGPEHYEVAATLHNLAAVLVTGGHLEEAERYYRRSLGIKEKLLGAESPDAALTRNNLGSLLTIAGRPREAAPLLESAVAILEKRLTSEHPHLAVARENLQKALLLLT